MGFKRIMYLVRGWEGVGGEEVRLRGLWGAYILCILRCMGV